MTALRYVYKARKTSMGFSTRSALLRYNTNILATPLATCPPNESPSSHPIASFAMSFRPVRPSTVSTIGTGPTEEISIRTDDDESTMTVSITKAAGHTTQHQGWIDLFVELLGDEDFAEALQASVSLEEALTDAEAS